MAAACANHCKVDVVRGALVEWHLMNVTFNRTHLQREAHIERCQRRKCWRAGLLGLLRGSATVLSLVQQQQQLQSCFYPPGGFQSKYSFALPPNTLMCPAASSMPIRAQTHPLRPLAVVKAVQP